MCGNAHDATRQLTDVILFSAELFVPTREILDAKSTHPWIDDACRAAIAAETSASSVNVREASNACCQVLRDAYMNYVKQCSAKLRSLSTGSKLWWKITRALMNKKVAASSVPPLLDAFSKEWALDPVIKANLIASTLSSKFVLPAAPAELQHANINEQHEQHSNFLLIRLRWARRVLSDLDADVATGPDQLPAKIMKMCCAVLAFPFCLLARLIIEQKCWPQTWALH